MKEWSREEKYRNITDPAQLLPLHEKVLSSRWRQHFHIIPVCGLLNDPNGFSRLGDTWHLFYQWCPWGAVHGLKHWYHVVSGDLVHWENRGLALSPGGNCDSKGVFSGSALVNGDGLYLYYTGNHRTKAWERVPYLCLARMDSEGRVQKSDAPLILPNKGYTEHQRDPKIFRRDGGWYIIIGAQTPERKGRILVYRSDSPERGWVFSGELHIPGYEDFGDMWECPSIERIGEKDLLIFCAQHLRLPGRGNTLHHNVCLIGELDLGALTFTPQGPFRLLDSGFDFYAAQCAAQEGEASDSLTLISWMGIPDAEYPSDCEEWSGCLTLPRRLRLEGGRLIQAPLRELETLRGERIPLFPGIVPHPRCCEIEISCARELCLSVFAEKDGSRGIRIVYDPAVRTLTVDRSEMALRFHTDQGESRSAVLPDGLESLRLFIDSSSLEIFANEGEAVFTSRVFPDKDECFLSLSEGACGTAWPLQDAVSTRFVL